MMILLSNIFHCIHRQKQHCRHRNLLLIRHQCFHKSHRPSLLRPHLQTNIDLSNHRYFLYFYHHNLRLRSVEQNQQYRLRMSRQLKTIHYSNTSNHIHLLQKCFRHRIVLLHPRLYFHKSKLNPLSNNLKNIRLRSLYFCHHILQLHFFQHRCNQQFHLHKPLECV